MALSIRGFFSETHNLFTCRLASEITGYQGTMHKEQVGNLNYQEHLSQYQSLQKMLVQTLVPSRCRGAVILACGFNKRMAEQATLKV